MQTPPRTRWFDDPRHVRLLWRGFVAVLVLLVLAELLVHLHPRFAIESVFGFAAWFGLAACAVIIAAAMGLGMWLKRPDSYYRDGGTDD